MKKSVWLLFVFGIFFVVFLGIVSATTYYANPVSGNDSDSGNITNPWKSIGPHLSGGPNLMSSGDVLLLENGTYNEGKITLGGLYTTLNGVTIEGQYAKGANVVFNNSFTKGFYPDDATINLRNFNISSTGSSVYCIYFRDASKNMIIENMVLYNCTYAMGVYSTAGQPTNISIRNNLFINNSNTLRFQASVTFINSSFYNNSVDDVLFFDNLNSSLEEFGSLQLDVVQNNITGGLIIGSSEWAELFSQENKFYPTYITIRNSVFPNYLNFSNLSFSHKNVPISSTKYYIQITNSSNINFENITFCSQSDFCTYDNPSASVIGIYSDSDSENLSVVNSSFYMQGYYVAAIYLSGKNLISKDNFVVNNGTAGFGIRFDGNNSLVDHNTVLYYNQSISYGIGLGQEGRLFWNAKSNITNNFVKSFGSSNTITHSIFLGYMQNSTVENNTVVGGGYNYVIKGDKNCVVKNNFGNQTSQIGMYEKGGVNNRFINNVIKSNLSSAFLVFIAWNDADGMNVTNSTWINNNFYCGIGSSQCMKFSTNAFDVYFYNTTVEHESISIVDPKTSLERYWPLTVSGTSGASFTMKDNQNNSYGSYNLDTFSTRYFLQENRTTLGKTNYTPYTLTASKSGCTSRSYSFNLTSPKSMTISLVCPSSSSSTSSGGTPDNFIYKAKSSDLQDGYSKLLKATQKIQVSYPDGKTNTYEIKSVNTEDKTVAVSYGGKDYSVSLDNVVKIDSNSDGYYDTEISVKEVRINGYANVEFKLISEKVPSENKDSQNENVKDNSSGNNPVPVEKNNSWQIYVGIGLVVVLIGLWIWLRKRK